MDFTNGEVIDLTDNIVSDSMYVQCNKVGNDILLLDSFVDYKKTERALSLQYQNLTVNSKSCMTRLTDGSEICVLWKS